MTTTSPLGTVHCPMVGEQLADPRPFFRQARAAEPVFFSEATGTWVVTRYEDVVACFKDTTTFSSVDTLAGDGAMPSMDALSVLMTGLMPAPTIINVDPPNHDRFRSAVGTQLSPRRVKQMEPWVRAINDELMDALGDGHVDLIDQFAYPFPLRVITHLFGIDKDRIDDFKRWGHDLLNVFSGAKRGEPAELDSAHGFVEYQKFLLQLIHDRRANPTDDMTSMLVNGSSDHGEPFTDEELVMFLIAMTFAGHETTTGLIGNAMRLLLSDRTLWDQLVADPTLAPKVVEEALRYDTPVYYFPRTATVDTEVGGVAIKKGQKLTLSLMSANHDESRFSEPEEFRFDREHAAQHLGFGWGIHFCVGAALARLEVAIALEAFATRFPNMRLAGAEPQYSSIMMLRNLQTLEVQLT